MLQPNFAHQYDQQPSQKPPPNRAAVSTHLVVSAKLKRIPTSPTEFSEEQIEEIEQLIDKLEDDEDVQAVYNNIA